VSDVRNSRRFDAESDGGSQTYFISAGEGVRVAKFLFPGYN